MLTAIDCNGIKRVAWGADKTSAPFTCQACLQEAIIKKGEVKIHHFAHKPCADCAYGTGETQEHYEAKKTIYEQLKKSNLISNVELEKILQGCRPDVYFECKGLKMAVELQKSNLSIQDIRRRTAQYDRLGIYVLWLQTESCKTYTYNSDSGQEEHRLKDWEKFLHSLYYGRIYMFEDGNIQAYHFEPVERWVEEKDWHNQYGEMESGGGYFKTLKNTVAYDKAPHTLNIISDFRIENKKAYQTVPQAKILIDKKYKWW